MKLLVLLNESATLLDGAKPDDVRARLVNGFTSAGAQAEVRIVDMRWINKHAHEAAGSDFDAVISAGDDRTASTVANALAAASARKPLGVLPIGNDSPVAGELGIPLQLDEAIAALARGTFTETFAGEINGRMFLNFCAVGTRASSPDLRISTRGRTVVRHTLAVIVTNNAHQARAFGIQPAGAPELGMLNLYFAAQPAPRTIVGRAWRRVFGQRDHFPRQFRAMTLPEVRIDLASGRKRKLGVDIDGELIQALPPLHFVMRTVPLRMLVPARPS